MARSQATLHNISKQRLQDVELETMFATKFSNLQHLTIFTGDAPHTEGTEHLCCSGERI